VSQDNLREIQAHNRAIAYYILGLFAVIAAAHEITVYLGG
jgi:hypothetical protein